jgi:hypothetical protein
MCARACLAWCVQARVCLVARPLNLGPSRAKCILLPDLFKQALSFVLNHPTPCMQTRIICPFWYASLGPEIETDRRSAEVATRLATATVAKQQSGQGVLDTPLLCLSSFVFFFLLSDFFYYFPRRMLVITTIVTIIIKVSIVSIQLASKLK